MIVGEHATIRTAGPDDAPYMQGLYVRGRPMAGVLDPKRELPQPSVDELRELLASKDFQQSGFYAVEDATGAIQGFCALRTSTSETFMGQLVVLLLDEGQFAEPLADEVWAFLRNDAFLVKRLNKVMAHCLDRETALRAFLERHGFTSDGIQREVLYTGGRWHNMESFTLFNPSRPAAVGAAAAEQ